MTLKHGLLGILTYQDATGYQLSKVFQNYLGFFWPAKTSQIYFELKAMEKQGWISSDIIVQHTRPNRKLYSITDTGRAEFMQWLAEAPLEIDIQLKQFLMRAFYGAERTTEANIRLFTQFCDRIEELIQHMEQVVVPQVAVYSTKYNLATKSEYWLMTVNYGILHYRASLQWGRECIAQLEAKLS